MCPGRRKLRHLQEFQWKDEKSKTLELPLNLILFPYWIEGFKIKDDLAQRPPEETFISDHSSKSIQQNTRQNMYLGQFLERTLNCRLYLCIELFAIKTHCSRRSWRRWELSEQNHWSQDEAESYSRSCAPSKHSHVLRQTELMGDPQQIVSTQKYSNIVNWMCSVSQGCTPKDTKTLQIDSGPKSLCNILQNLKANVRFLVLILSVIQSHTTLIRRQTRTILILLLKTKTCREEGWGTGG